MPSLLLPSPPKPTTEPTITALLSFEVVILASSTLRFSSGTMDKTSANMSEGGEESTQAGTSQIGLRQVSLARQKMQEQACEYKNTPAAHDVNAQHVNCGEQPQLYVLIPGRDDTTLAKGG
jgi:hypothetical protein